MTARKTTSPKDQIPNPPTRSRKTTAATPHRAGSLGLKRVPAKPAEARGTVAKAEPKAVVKADKPAVVRPVTVKLSHGTYKVAPRDIEQQKVTETTEDFLTWVEAVTGVSLAGYDRRVLALIATGKNFYQAAVRDGNPNARGQQS